MTYRNSTEALVEGLRDSLAQGQELTVRGSNIRELRNRFMILSRPLERTVIVPKRNNSVFAAIAETVWVLAGRDDIEFLSSYLPRAGEFSDDGRTWRGAYGPRLRNWNGVDQIKECLNLISYEPATRRATMSLFNPEQDYVQSKDIPCNNWIHWLVRDERLHMSVAIRSNDIVWGFSGINTFEWSIFHELMSLWTGFQVGDASFLASSFHLYERHYDKAKQIIEGFSGQTCYDCGLSSPAPTTGFEDLNIMLGEWFNLETAIRTNPDSSRNEVESFTDPLFRHFLEVLRLSIAHQAGWSQSALESELALIKESDLTAAAIEFLRRTIAITVPTAHTRTIAFFEACFDSKPLTHDSVDSKLRRAITFLHREKSAAYGNSWKKRGEQMSVLANIARKVDRLSQLANGGTASRDESLLDTAIDLYVYAIKYQTFLADTHPELAAILVPDSSSASPYSEGSAGFELRLARAPTMIRAGAPPELRAVAADIMKSLDDLERAVQETPKPGRRLEASTALVENAALGVWVACDMLPATLRRFIREFGGDSQ